LHTFFKHFPFGFKTNLNFKTFIYSVFKTDRILKSPLANTAQQLFTKTDRKKKNIGYENTSRSKMLRKSLTNRK